MPIGIPMENLPPDPYGLPPDPFDPSSASGIVQADSPPGSQAPAASMPPETDVYLSIDLLQLTGEDTTGALVETIRAVLERLGEDVNDPDDLIADLDDALRASAGFDFSNDIRPWIGRTVGVGVLGGNWDPMDYTSTPDVLVAVEVRNDDEAREFLETL